MSYCNLTSASVSNLPFSLLPLSELLVHKALIHTLPLLLWKLTCISVHSPKKICLTYNSNAVNEIIGLKCCTLVVYIVKTFAVYMLSKYHFGCHFWSALLFRMNCMTSWMHLVFFHDISTIHTFSFLFFGLEKSSSSLK